MLGLLLLTLSVSPGKALSNALYAIKTRLQPAYAPIVSNGRTMLSAPGRQPACGELQMASLSYSSSNTLPSERPAQTSELAQ